MGGRAAHGPGQGARSAPPPRGVGPAKASRRPRLRLPAVELAFLLVMLPRCPRPRRGLSRRYRAPVVEGPALPVGWAATGRATRHLGQFACRSPVAGNTHGVLHHGEQSHPPLATGADEVGSAEENLVGERVADVLLDDPHHRTRADLRVAALPSEPGPWPHVCSPVSKLGPRAGPFLFSSAKRMMIIICKPPPSDPLSPRARRPRTSESWRPRREP